jgi:hypothetical protein
MSEFTYQFPPAEAFMYTLHKCLESEGATDIAAALTGASCSFMSDGQYTSRRWNEYGATLILTVRSENLHALSEERREEILRLANRLMPAEAGYLVISVETSPLLEAPPAEDDFAPANAGRIGTEASVNHDGLRFRSKTETRIYDALRSRRVLFFPLPTAVLGGTDRVGKREPDFLVCQDGRWGILEVMGEPYHPAATAMRDHDRARGFQDYGLLTIQFYDASRCYEHPDQVVDDFLRRLRGP